MRPIPFSIAVLLTLMSAGDASAQRSPGSTSSASPGNVVSSAKQILGGDGSQAGDANLTCDQIGQEMQAFMGGDDMTSMLASAQRADSEVKKSQAELAVRQKTEGPAMVAAAMAETKAAVGMSMAPLTAIGQVTAAKDALAARKKMEALHQMQAGKAVQGGQAGNSATQAYKQSAANLVTNNTDQMTRMRALTELSEKKGCGPPPGMPAGGYGGDEGEDEEPEEDSALIDRIQNTVSGAAGMTDSVMGLFKKKK